MDDFSPQFFECHLYVSAGATLQVRLPAQSGPRRIVRLEPLNHDTLIEPRFRYLLAAFESVTTSTTPRPAPIVQV